jgi:hypothetical protein
LISINNILDNFTSCFKVFIEQDVSSLIIEVNFIDDLGW